jgi:hypothetical protein
MTFTNRERAIVNYHLIMSFLIPLVLYIIFEDLRLLGFVLCFSVVSAKLYELTQSDLFYGLITKRKHMKKTESAVYKISRILVIFLTIVGILLHSANENGRYTVLSIPVFIFLSLFFLVFAPQGAEFTIKQVYEYTKDSTPNKTGSPDTIILAALLYTIFIIYFQWSLMELIKITKYLN